MKAIIKYLLQDAELLGLLDNKESIYYIEKPQKLNDENYIIYKDKILSSGFIRDYQLQLDIIGKDLSKLVQIKDRIIYLLDDIRNEIVIKDEETTIKLSKLLNGGGVIKNPDTDNWHIVVYFLVKI